MKDNKVVQGIDRVLTTIEKIILAMDCVILFAIVIVVVTQVISRYLRISMSGTEELARYGYVIFVFYAWSIAALRGSDVSVMVIFDRFPFKVRQTLLGIYHVLMAAFACMVFKSCKINAVNQSMIPSPNNAWMMMGWLYSIVEVGIFFTIIANLIRAFRLWTRIDIYLTEDERNSMAIEESLRQSELEAAAEASENIMKGGSNI